MRTAHRFEKSKDLSRKLFLLPVSSWEKLHRISGSETKLIKSLCLQISPRNMLNTIVWDSTCLDRFHQEFRR